MTRVVINQCFGGFGLSPQAMERLRALGWGGGEYVDLGDLRRDDPRLLQVVDELGGLDASGDVANLAVVEVPDDVKWHIEEYDGNEWVAEDHRTWGREEGPE